LLHTWSTAVAPDFDRRSEVFDTFLHDTFGDDTELAGYVQRLVGIFAIGSVLEKLPPFAVGRGANGKSTLLERQRIRWATATTAMRGPARRCVNMRSIRPSWHSCPAPG
jgi:hypothetical protein